MKKRRVFVGFKIPEKIKKRVNGWKKKSNFLKDEVRWIEDDNLHITLIPPWETEKVEEVKNKILLVKNYVKPIKVIFETIEFGPRARSPRLIWAKGRSGIEILELKNKLEEVLEIKGSQRFLLHLTLARFPREFFKNFKRRYLKEEIFWSDWLDSLSLFESIFKKGGVYYKTLLEISSDQK